MHRRAQDESARDDQPRDRSTARRTGVVAALVAGLLVLTVPAATAWVRPLANTDVPDPSIARTSGSHLVVVGTGEQVVRMSSPNGRRWRMASNALITRPSWARPTGAIWASEIVRLRGRWVLYYAVPVRGMSASSRCIGVAVANSPTGRFVPRGAAPLVCPPDADVPRAGDPMLDPGRSAPVPATHGAIDPSVYQDSSGVWLIYKTDGRPSSLRIVPLVRNGLGVAGGSRALLVSSGVVENPTMVKRGRFYYLFTSEGDYTRCSYATVYRRSTSLMSWRRAAARPVLTQANTGLCGPGGADTLVTGHGKNAKVSLYFHAWVCGGAGRPCANPFHAWNGQEDARRPVRALYGTRLTFTKRGFAVRGAWIRRR
jgi:arabinan endo-1,5-alpha-L-arabinosidase